MRRLGLFLLAVLCVVVGSNVLIVPPVSIGSSGIIPAPTGGLAPTIALSVNHGYAEQAVTVTGNGINPYPAVRLAWLLDGATQTAAIATLHTNAYTTTLTVPDEATPGAAKICATVTGTAQAEFACAPFTIDPPPPGSVSGQIPLTSTLQPGFRPQALNAFFALYDNAGTEVAQAPINPDGSFTLDNVPRGVYQTGVVGEVPLLVETPPLIVDPGQITTANVLFSGCHAARIASMGANPASPTAIRTVAGGATVSQEFGTYVNLGPTGTPVNVTFTATLQTAGGPIISDVTFEIKRPDGTRFTIGTDTTAPYQAAYNVSLLPAGTSTLYVTVHPQLGSCTSQAPIFVIADPMKDPNIQPGGATTWNAGTQRYDFQGAIPNVGGILPLIYTTPNLPLVGTLESKLSAGLFFVGSLQLNGQTTITVINAAVLARLLSFNVYNSTQSLLGANSIIFNRNNPAASALVIAPRTLFSYNTSMTVFSGPLASFWGVVTVKASVSVGIGGQLTIQGILKPLKPAAEVILTPIITPSVTASVWVDLLLSVASAGADVTTSAALSLPLHINTEATPKVKFDQTCLRLRAVLSAWARVNLRFYKKTWNIGNYTLLDHNPCGLALANRPGADPIAVPPPSVIASPSVAASPSGQALAVYVLNTTPNQITPTMRIAAATWNTLTQRFDAPALISDPIYAVQDPVVAYTTRGGQETPVVAWTETVMSLAEDDAGPTDDLNYYLRRQEIFASMLISGTWTTPQRLTNDLIPDGRAALAGDADHVRLAWTRDLDGDITTRGDTRIATTDWRDDVTGWRAFELLAAPTISATTSNSQVSVALAPPGQLGDHLAWTVDLDANLDTNADRYLAWSNNQSGGWNTVVLTEAQHMPAGIDSPSIDFDPQSSTGTPSFAFIVRTQDGDGMTDTGIGNQGRLWRAYSDLIGLHSEPVMDGPDFIYAEKPVLRSTKQGRMQLIFRRFGAAGTMGALGQLALAVSPSPTETLSPPLYLTGDDARQHGQPAVTLDPVTGNTLILNVSRAAVSDSEVQQLQRVFKPVSSAARSDTHPRVVAAQNAAQDDPVESLLLEAGADPAIDPALAISTQHALPGSTVWVTATVRNVGLQPASDIVVHVYSTGTVLSQVGVFTVTGPLEVNEPVSLTLPVTRTAGPQQIVVQITASNSNTSVTNDTALVDLQAMPAPGFPGVAVSALSDQALDVSWLPVEVPGIEGYRILRREPSDAPGLYDLVGEAIGPAYTDRLLQRGRTYCYAVEAYDAVGVLSARSAEVCGTLANLRVFLPLVMKAP